jgi:hypothetical protein
LGAVRAALFVYEFNIAWSDFKPYLFTNIYIWAICGLFSQGFSPVTADHQRRKILTPSLGRLPSPNLGEGLGVRAIF